MTSYARACWICDQPTQYQKVCAQCSVALACTDIKGIPATLAIMVVVAIVSAALVGWMLIV